MKKSTNYIDNVIARHDEQCSNDIVHAFDLLDDAIKKYNISNPKEPLDTLSDDIKFEKIARFAFCGPLAFGETVEYSIPFSRSLAYGKTVEYSIPMSGEFALDEDYWTKSTSPRCCWCNTIYGYKKNNSYGIDCYCEDYVNPVIPMIDDLSKIVVSYCNAHNEIYIILK